MEITEVKEMLDEIGFPIAYNNFEEESEIEPPFITYIIPSVENIRADGKWYIKISELSVELYTDSKDIDAESRVESILDNKELNYRKSEAYLDDERLFLILYQLQV